MKPTNLTSKIFVDSGFPEETKQVLDMLGFLDGQTTNPSLVAKKLLSEDPEKKLTQKELLDAYCKIIGEISYLIPKGSVSIEVYADTHTKASEMIAQAKEMNTWIPNAHIKLPTTHEGLIAAKELAKLGMRLNMTLVFSQEQAAAIHAATQGAHRGDVFVSPFIGRLDDRGENGMDLIKNIAHMYKSADSHAMVLAASLRNIDHFYGSIKAGAHIMTCPMPILEEWYRQDMNIPDTSYEYPSKGLSEIVYKELDLSQDWKSFEIAHELTDIGLTKFAQDWNDLIAS